MLSTLTSYRVYSNDISKSLDRLQASAAVAKDQKYYDQNIGKVTSVDDFLSDQRLYTYAMKAYGLEDQIQSKGFMRKVIESDLADSKSFANVLADSRYRDFASAFTFGTAAATKTAQSAGQTESLVEAYSESRVRSGIAAAAKTAYFQDNIGQVQSVDDLLGDNVLYDVAMRSVGLDPAAFDKEFVRGVFTTLAGTPNVDGLTALGDLATTFSFTPGGAVAPGGTALSSTAAEKMVHDYYTATGNGATAPAAAHETAYFTAEIGTITDAYDLVHDDRLFNYIVTSAGLDRTLENPNYIWSVLVGDPTDANGLFATLPTDTAAGLMRKERLISLHDAFAFPADGEVSAGAAQNAAATAATTDNYFVHYAEAAEAREASKISTFKLFVSKSKSLTDLMAFDPAFGRDALNVALQAFDLDPATESLVTIRRVLQSDPSDPNSFVGKLGDERYLKLAAAFNFDANGKIRTQQRVQSTGAQATTGSLYKSTFGTKLGDDQTALIKASTKSYLESIAGIHTLKDFLKADTTVSYALKAYGLDKDKTLDDTKLQKILTSDLGDRSSYVYTLKDARYEKFAAAFNFTKTGTVRIESSGVQTDVKRLSTENLYLLRKLEANAGEAGEGTRLALYFLRKSPDIKSTLSILADKALTEVVRTTLSLPDSFSQLDIDAQVKVIDKKMKVADLQDAKKLDKFIARFAGLYDLKNNSGASAPVMALFGSSDTSTGLLASL